MDVRQWISTCGCAELGVTYIQTRGLDGRELWEPGTGLREAVGNEGLNVGTVV